MPIHVSLNTSHNQFCIAADGYVINYRIYHKNGLIAVAQ